MAGEIRKPGGILPTELAPQNNRMRYLLHRPSSAPHRLLGFVHHLLHLCQAALISSRGLVAEGVGWRILQRGQSLPLINIGGSMVRLGPTLCWGGGRGRSSLAMCTTMSGEQCSRGCSSAAAAERDTQTGCRERRQPAANCKICCSYSGFRY